MLHNFVIEQTLISFSSRFSFQFTLNHALSCMEFYGRTFSNCFVPKVVMFTSMETFFQSKGLKFKTYIVEQIAERQSHQHQSNFLENLICRKNRKEQIKLT